MSLRSTLSKTHKNDSSDRVQTVAQPLLYLVLEGSRPLGGGMRVSLAKVDEVRFGRGRERTVAMEGKVLTITVPDPRMSGKHARLVRAGSGWALEDTGSTNGTFVNEEHLGFNGRRELKDGDRIRFGGYTTTIKVIQRI